MTSFCHTTVLNKHLPRVTLGLECSKALILVCLGWLNWIGWKVAQKQACKQINELKACTYKSNFAWLENLQGKFLSYRLNSQLSSVSAVLQGSNCPLCALSMQLSSPLPFRILSFLSPALPRSYHTIAFSCSCLWEVSNTRPVLVNFVLAAISFWILPSTGEK